MRLLLSSVVVGGFSKSYEKGDLIPINIGRLYSPYSLRVYEYFDLDYCRPAAFLQVEDDFVLWRADTATLSPYEVKMLVQEDCKILCVHRLSLTALEEFRAKIFDEYRWGITADGLPGGLKVGRKDSDNFHAYHNLSLRGVPVGAKLASGGMSLNNHLDILVRYFPRGKNGGVVVGFEFDARSIDHSGEEFHCDDRNSVKLKLENLHEGDRVVFTYSTYFAESDISLSTRWDNYVRDQATEIHWLSIINSFLIVVMLSTICSTILLRILQRDIASYNDEETLLETHGWKLVHGDVFRRPRFAKLLATCTGTGIQVLFMIFITLMISVLGFISPNNRTSLINIMLVFFASMGIPAGYVAARFIKLFDSEQQQQPTIERNATPATSRLKQFGVTTMWTAFQYTGICFLIYLLMNLVLWFQNSASTTSIYQIIYILTIWFGVSVPLVFIGAYLGYRSETIKIPTRINPIPRQIPPTTFALAPLSTALLGGLLPFVTVVTEMTFLLTSVWNRQFYFLFGFLALVVAILVLTSAQTSIILTYFLLSKEYHRWWWRAFFNTGTSALYLAIYCVVHYFNVVKYKSAQSTILFFGYTVLASYTFMLLTGAIGLISSFVFLLKIYSAVKIQ